MRSWEASIRVQRKHLAKYLTQSPSLRRELPELLSEKHASGLCPKFSVKTSERPRPCGPPMMMKTANFAPRLTEPRLQGAVTNSHVPAGFSTECPWAFRPPMLMKNPIPHRR
jgi:hypothetical protein